LVFVLGFCFLFFYDKLAGGIGSGRMCKQRNSPQETLKLFNLNANGKLAHSQLQKLLFYRNEFEYLEVFKAYPQSFTKSFSKKMQDRKNFDEKSIQKSRNKLI
jgi:hypothetical protein